MPYVTTKTVAYIFALVIDCVTVIHQDSSHSLTLQHEASILKELDSMPPDDLRTEFSGSLTDFCENILKKAGAGGRPVAMPLSRKFVTKAASLPAPDPHVGAATTTMSRYLKLTPTPLRRRRALLLRKRPPRSCGSTDVPPRGGVPAEAVASPRLLD